MNISTTAKRLLSAATMLSIVAVGSSAYAATYTYSDDFESDTAGLFPGSTGSGMTWAAGAGDASTVASTNRPSWDGSTVPVTPTALSKVLDLDTQGATVTNDTASIAADGTVYIDQMVYLVPSETVPPAGVLADTSIQTAVFVDTASNLWVVAQVGGSTNAAIMLDEKVTPEEWARLTVVVNYDPGLDNIAMFKVQVNGMDMTNSVYGRSEPIYTAGTPGAWFFSANSSTPFNTLSSIAYQGTGMIDDVVVTDQDPFGTIVTEYNIYSEVTGGTADPADDPIVVAANGSTSVTYTATETYGEITAFYENGNWVTDAIGETTYERVYTSVTNNFTNAVTFEVLYAYDGTTPLGWVFEWPGATNGPDQDNDGLVLAQEELLQSDPTVSNAFEIVEIGFETGGLPYLKYLSWGAPNGDLTVSNTTDLVNGPWTSLTTSNITTEASGVTPPVAVKWLGADPAGSGDSMKIYVTTP